MEEYHDLDLDLDLWTLSSDQSQLLRLTMDLLEVVHAEDSLLLLVGLLAKAVAIGSNFRTNDFPKELTSEAWIACNHAHMGTRVDSLFHVVLLAYGYGRHSILN